MAMTNSFQNENPIKYHRVPFEISILLDLSTKILELQTRNARSAFAIHGTTNNVNTVQK